jgi:hypothetical protein
MSEHFDTNHPKNGLDITITMDEDLNLMHATYRDNNENVAITPELKNQLQLLIQQRVAE